MYLTMLIKKYFLVFDFIIIVTYESFIHISISKTAINEGNALPLPINIQ